MLNSTIYHYSEYLESWEASHGDADSFERECRLGDRVWTVTQPRLSEEEFYQVTTVLSHLHDEIDAALDAGPSPETRLKLEQLFLKASPLEALVLA